MTDLSSFPRGRDNLQDEISPAVAKKEGKKREAADFLFGTPSSTTTPKRRKSSDKAKTTVSRNRSLLPLGGGGVVQSGGKGKSGDDAYIIEALGFAKLHAGLRLLGVVRQVHDDVCVVSLPHQWTGVMMASTGNAQFPCHAMFQVGDVMAVRIVQAVQEDNRRRIQVTALPSKLNSPDTDGLHAHQWIRGQIISAEDHGFLVDLGWQRRGFVKYNEIPTDDYEVVSGDADAMDVTNDRVKLGPGRVFDFWVQRTGNDPVTSLQVLPRKEGTQKLSVANLPPLEDLMPGLLVQCAVDKIVRNGLCVSFGAGKYRGAIELSHLGGFWIPDHREASTQWKKVFEKHGTLQARIIAVDPSAKLIRLSLQRRVLDMVMPPSVPEIGSIHDAIVVRLDDGIGALLALEDRQLPSVDEAIEKDSVLASTTLYQDESYQRASQVQCAYVHISKAMETSSGGRTSAAAFAKDFAPSTRHRVRILHTSNMIEGILSGAAAPRILDAKVLSYHDLVAGQLYKQLPITKHLEKGGIVVSFGMGVSGTVPATHLFDKNATSEFRSRMRKVKYAINAKIDVRVLSVDPAQKKCVLTAKKSMVHETSIISRFEDVVVGQKSTGYISKIDPYGMTVTFFNGVFGRVTKRSLRNELGLVSASEQYGVGDVVSCQVVQVKKKVNDKVSYSSKSNTNSRPYYEITLSLRENQEIQSTAPRDTEVQIRTGAVLPAKTLRVLELVPGKQKEGSSFVPGYAIVEVPAKSVIEGGLEANMIECKLPFDQLFDTYERDFLESPQKLHKLAKKVLVVGEKINQKSILLTNPKKSSTEFKSGTGRLTLVSLRPQLVELAEKGESTDLKMPGPETDIFVGAKVAGYVCQIDQRFGAFVRFFDGLTGLVPKLKGGAELPLYATVKATIIAIDVSKSPPKILLGKAQSLSSPYDKPKSEVPFESSYKIGDMIFQAKVGNIEFEHATAKSTDLTTNHEIRIHCTMAPFDTKTNKKGKELHPFYKWTPGMDLPPLKVVAVKKVGNFVRVDVQVTAPTPANKSAQEIPEFLMARTLRKRQRVCGIIGDRGDDENRGVWVMLGPNLSGFLYSHELSDNEKDLSHALDKFPKGTRVSCTVVEVVHSEGGRVHLSLFEGESRSLAVGDVVLGRINHKHHGVAKDSVALYVDVKGGFTGRCCITELRDREDWVNLPLSTSHWNGDDADTRPKNHKGLDLRHGSILTFKVLEVSGKHRRLELSLRKSRMNGDLENDPVPEVGSIAQAYVMDTNKKGCFMQLSRHTNGRCILKNLSDGFLSDPAASFPPGRLVVGKVTGRREEIQDGHSRFFLDLNLRESAVSDAKKHADLHDIEIGQTFRGTVTRVEDYGVFVQLEGSSVFGLVHKSECSDHFVKDVSAIYSPGDLVKVYVLKKDESKKQIGLSMKPSYFVDEGDGEDSQSEEEADSDAENGIQAMEVEAESSDDENDSDAGEQEQDDEREDNVMDNEIKALDDENESSSSESSDESEEDNNEENDGMEMDVGFDWGAGNPAVQAGHSKEESDSSSDESDSDDEDEVPKEKVNRSRKNKNARRREEKHISEREKSLADGTADENPETAGDYERLVTSHPNSSELWIRYMAFFLSLADVDAARKVAERALDRIEFREEREKLNVWCALLTLELKYGTEDTVDATIKRACAQSNPKQVYLRVCEIMENELNQGGSVTGHRVESMLATACKKFKSKKKVWIAYAAYLLRSKKYDEALAVSKRALLSLPGYKHTEMMTRMAQLMFEHDRVDQARTVFDGLLAKNAKRLDLLSVYIDKEVKHGTIEHARQLFRDIARGSRSMKLNEKQMKRLFKRWYTFEEKHGTSENCDEVKQAAIEYVEAK